MITECPNTVDRKERNGEKTGGTLDSETRVPSGMNTVMRERPQSNTPMDPSGPRARYVTLLNSPGPSPSRPKLPSTLPVRSTQWTRFR